MSTGSDPAQAREFLARHPELRHVQLMQTDLNGILRGKSIQRAELERIYNEGLPLPSSIAALTADGDDAENTGLLWEIGDMDCLAWPLPGTLVPTPWLKTPSAQVLMMFDAEQGGPAAAADPRLAAARVIRLLQEDGYTPVMAVELEFYLLDAEAARAGRAQAASTRGRHPHVYSVEEIESRAAFLDDLYACCEAQGLPVSTTISEFGPGQFEITLKHRSDALRALDEGVMYKRAVRGVAQRHGLWASFMAKPFPVLPGSGLHLHLSLNDANGCNVFAAEALDGNDLLKHAIGGMAASAGDMMALFAPFGNSYRRYQAYNCAPLVANWGVNNRTVALRIPTGPAASRHVEHRICGADANPYAVAAAVLAGVHHGLRKRIDPGPAVSGDAYQQKNHAALPRDWLSAIDRFADSAFARDYFGQRFVEVYCAIKRTESGRYFGEVPQQDYDWYLHTL
ncbi:MAG: glutamine synthetase [Proteobacteria bacterium]|nr:glutamine synthetase [Pseudomonadota bacterium]